LSIVGYCAEAFPREAFTSALSITLDIDRPLLIISSVQDINTVACAQTSSAGRRNRSLRRLTDDPQLTVQYSVQTADLSLSAAVAAAIESLSAPELVAAFHEEATKANISMPSTLAVPAELMKAAVVTVVLLSPVPPPSAALPTITPTPAPTDTPTLGVAGNIAIPHTGEVGTSIKEAASGPVTADNTNRVDGFGIFAVVAVAAGLVVLMVGMFLYVTYQTTSKVDKLGPNKVLSKSTGLAKDLSKQWHPVSSGSPSAATPHRAPRAESPNKHNPQDSLALEQGAARSAAMVEECHLQNSNLNQRMPTAAVYDVPLGVSSGALGRTKRRKPPPPPPKGGGMRGVARGIGVQVAGGGQRGGVDNSRTGAAVAGAEGTASRARRAERAGLLADDIIEQDYAAAAPLTMGEMHPEMNPLMMAHQATNKTDEIQTGKQRVMHVVGDGASKSTVNPPNAEVGAGVEAEGHYLHHHHHYHHHHDASTGALGSAGTLLDAAVGAGIVLGSPSLHTELVGLSTRFTDAEAGSVRAPDHSTFSHAVAMLGSSSDDSDDDEDGEGDEDEHHNHRHHHRQHSNTRVESEKSEAEAQGALSGMVVRRAGQGAGAGAAALRAEEGVSNSGFAAEGSNLLNLTGISNVTSVSTTTMMTHGEGSSSEDDDD
jgi:hypothetical protein